MSHSCRRTQRALSFPRLPLPVLACCALLIVPGGAKGEPKTADNAPMINHFPVTDNSPRTSGGRLTVAFHGLRSRAGFLRVSVYDRADGFPNGPSVARRDIRLQDLSPALPLDSLTMTFAGLPSGAYAVCAFHDVNGDGKMAQNFLGIPQEEWGMSGNPRPRFRAPRFDEARMDLSAPETKAILITLHT